MSLVSKLDNNSCIKVPDEILTKAGLKPGTDVIWMYDDELKQIIILEKPQNFAKALKGLGKEMWKDIDPLTYVQEERNSWQ